MKLTYAKRFATFVLFLFCVGCTDTGETSKERGSATEGGLSSTSSDGQATEPYLPELNAEVCEPEHKVLSACDWASSLDALVWATIIDIQPSSSWKVAGTDGFELSDSCETGTIGLELTIEPDQALRGSLPSQMPVTIGGSVVQSWTRRPYIDSSGQVAWKIPGVEGKENVQAPFDQGHQIGVALHHAEGHDRWTTAGEHLFLAQENESGGAVVSSQEFLSEGLCSIFDQPSEIDGVTVNQFEELVSNCDTTAAADNRGDTIETLYLNDTAQVFAGTCRDSGSSGDTQCFTDTDCEGTDVCSNGQCVSP